MKLSHAPLKEFGVRGSLGQRNGSVVHPIYPYQSIEEDPERGNIERVIKEKNRVWKFLFGAAVHWMMKISYS